MLQSLSRLSAVPPSRAESYPSPRREFRLKARQAFQEVLFRDWDSWRS